MIDKFKKDSNTFVYYGEEMGDYLRGLCDNEVEKK